MDQAADRNRYTVALNKFHRETVPLLEAKFLKVPPNANASLNSFLEHHVRTFVIDELLESMGWKIRTDATGVEPLNMLSEAPIKKGGKSRTQFLDYLGFDREVNLPLLVFEAKRLGLDPPSVLVEAYRQTVSRKSAVTAGTQLPVDSKKAFLEGLAPTTPAWLKGEWKKHVRQLKDYVEATVNKFGRPPYVMVIGNGEWMLIIRNPSLVFDGKGDETHLEIIDEPQLDPGHAYRVHFDLIHGAIAYGKLAGQAPHLPPELLPQAIREAVAVEITRGLSVGYTSTDTKQRPGSRPHIDILPVVLVRQPGGEWTVVSVAAEGFSLPNNSGTSEPLRFHLEEVKTASDSLIERLQRTVSAKLVEVDLPMLNREGARSGQHRFVTRENLSRETHSQDFLLITRTSAHFIQLVPRKTCAFHDWSKCDAFSHGRHPPDRPLSAPSYAGLRSFFPNGRDHHCAAAATFNSKSRLQTNPALTTGAATTAVAKKDKAFCQIFDFEAMLCCQTCAYLEVCSSSVPFKLPCSGC
jgi:hypothetical protein